MASKVYKLGDDINTDVILPGRYLNITDPTEMASHCMEAIDPDYNKKVKTGDIIVGGRNFGCGSSRENAVIAIKASGISVVIAESFARIFFRNSINVGLPLLESAEAVRVTDPGDELEVYPEKGLIVNKTKGKTFNTIPQPKYIQELYAAGGLLPYIKSTIKK
jgi:3-isopropylmalate/(R)-2-methylmalate dehydratase small subunit